MENAAPGSAHGDALFLESQIVASDSQELEAALTEKRKNQPDAQPPESEPVEDKPADPSEKSEDDGAEEKQEEAPEDSKDKEESETVYKIGAKEFGDVADIVKEANRLMGNNSNLVGQLNTAKGQLEEATTALAEALKVNQQWVAWHAALENGEASNDETPAPEQAPKLDPKEFAKQVIEELKAKQEQVSEELKAKQEQERVVEMYRTQHAAVTATSNYAEVSETYNALADKINPLTGNYFTPTEAYEYSCRHLGLESELNAEEKKQKTPPKTVANPDAIKKAARPQGANAPTPTPTNEKSWEDRELESAFPTL